MTEPTGPDLLVFVTLNQTKVCCRLAPDVACRVGDSLNLQFDPARVLLFDAASGERLHRHHCRSHEGQRGALQRPITRLHHQ